MKEKGKNIFGDCDPVQTSFCQNIQQAAKEADYIDVAFGPFLVTPAI